MLDNALDCAGIAVWDTNLSAEEVIRLGTVEEPIP
jgi:hypothetical protein